MMPRCICTPILCLGRWLHWFSSRARGADGMGSGVAGEQGSAPRTNGATSLADRLRRALSLAPWALVCLGSGLRLAWVSDMEWKLDEKWMFDKAQRVARGSDDWPWVGMPSGVGLENPGLSLWPFALLARLTHDPVTMAQAVATLNVLALWGFMLWVLRTWPREDRELGLWGIALFAISPLPILFARKIWAQDLLPVLLLPWLWAHARRATPAGAVGFGLLGALLGQLHMSGFFVAAALFAVTVRHDGRRFPWLAWLAGSACGALLLLPWLRFVLSVDARHPVTGGPLSLRFFVEACTSAWGLGLRYPLGHAYRLLLKGPELFGVATHAGALARAGLVLLAMFACVVIVRDRKQLTLSAPLRLYMWTIVLGGLLLSAARVQIYAHYLIAWSPLLHIAAAWTLLRRRWALALVCGCQLALSVSFLWFIHQRGGAPEADYGVAFSHQSEAQRRVTN
jgi:hypothetical protein